MWAVAAPSSRWGCWRPLALGVGVELGWACGALVGWALPASLAVLTGFPPCPPLSVTVVLPLDHLPELEASPA